MYSESLVTPHPRKTAGLERQALEEQLQLTRIGIELQELGFIDLEAQEIAKQEVIDHIATGVNRALWFPVHGDSRYPEDAMLPNPLPLDSIKSLQTTNCFGYTLVASECLEKASIDHWIAYANGHAFLLVPFSEGRTYFMDALSPHINGFIEDAIERGNQATIAQQIDDSKRAIVMLNTQKVGEMIGTSAETIAEKYPWFTMQSLSSPRRADNKDSEHAKYKGKHRLIMTVFDREAGRQSIEDYVSYEVAMSTNDISSAHTAMLSMSGLFLNADARQSHTEVKSLVRKLCVTDPISATALAETYFESNFRHLNDSRIHEAKGDIFRTIARVARFKDAAEMATHAYREAVKMPNSFTAAVLGKLSVATQLESNL